MTPTMAVIVNRLSTRDDPPLSTTIAVRYAWIGGCGTKVGFGNARCGAYAMATSLFRRLALGAGGSILKPPTPGAIEGGFRDAIGDSTRDEILSASTPSSRRERRLVVVSPD
jgi:hypothetical protein